MNYCKYDEKKHKDSVFRILNEVGWVDDKKNDKYLNILLPNENALVHEINGEAEVMVVSSEGEICHMENKLKFAATTGVVNSLLTRKQGLAGRLTAIKMAMDAEDGAEVAGLQIFDQGYYNKLGYGNGNYERFVAFTPSTLMIDRKVKQPTRLTEKDFKQIHKSRANRLKGHGAITLGEYTTKAEMGEDDKTIGFGYFDDKGELTHHIWIYGKGKENGPIWIPWMSYQNLDQLMDLLALIKSFEEQYHLVRMYEPPHIQIQDFIERPFLNKAITRKSEYQNEVRTSSFWQVRILDLAKCLAKTELNCEDIRFNLELSDPIEKFLPKEFKWRGVAGKYIVTLGKKSSSVEGEDSSLPTMKVSVNGFSRLWLGIAKASALVYSDGLEAPETLIEELDRKIQLPTPRIDWDF